MIKANELRVGNLISLEVHPDLPRPHQVMPKDIFDIAEGRVTLSSIEGVKLTPEILEKAGFERHETDTLFRRNTFYLHRYVFGGIKMDGNEYCFKYNNYRSSSIIYLHQLQNLYFALTGEELTVNL